MRSLILIAAAAVLASAPAGAASPSNSDSSPVGLWSMPQGGARIQISTCGRAICGRLVDADRLKSNPGLTDKKNRNPALRGRPVKNLLVMQGFTGTAPDWSNGSVYNPDDGRTYRGSMRLTDPSTLKLTGCVVRPLCKSQTLMRVE